MTAFVPDGFDYDVIGLIRAKTCALCPRTREEYHHTSYKPEEVIPVCKKCHHAIHHFDGYHDELKPDRTRPFEYKSSFKNSRKRFTRKKESILRTCGPGNHEFITICAYCDCSAKRLEDHGLLSDGEEVSGT